MEIELDPVTGLSPFGPGIVFTGFIRASRKRAGPTQNGPVLSLHAVIVLSRAGDKGGKLISR